MDEAEHRALVVLRSLDEATASINRALAHPVADMRHVFVRSALFHWLAVSYDAGLAHGTALANSEL